MPTRLVILNRRLLHTEYGCTSLLIKERARPSLHKLVGTGAVPLRSPKVGQNQLTRCADEPVGESAGPCSEGAARDLAEPIGVT
ncbi:hypothetical protein TIFTF001_006933 [Ficus carica]|uniref:Uncharacterized protein n=1 Tax=Ficus carica TaxID=3494 RepID=A0AA87ZS77_FICCA|nr:hypothetical protein TIFTF001_006933 [Ficus carica]